MVDIFSILIDFTSFAIIFLIGEVIEWFLLVNDGAGWHFRFGHAEGYSKLNPVISTFKVALILFVIILFITPFLLPQIWNTLVVNLVKSTEYWFLLAIGSITFTFLWIWHHIVGKDWNWKQYVLLIITIISLVIYLWINFK
ncbi:MAG: hypothetical protein WA139_01400 [Candidatus Aenigmatarchaeota archaeon]